MTHDFDLLEWAETQRTPAEENTIRAAFEAFHALHPEVYRLFEGFTLEAIASGSDTLGAKAVWERLRWETHVAPLRGYDARTFKLNNNFTAYYAREFMTRHPEFPHVFRTRKVGS